MKALSKGERYKQGTLEKVKLKAGWCWFLRYTVVTSERTSRPRERIGLVSEFRNRTELNRAADVVRRRINQPGEGSRSFGEVIERYIASAKLPEQHSTRRGYLSMINCHIRPRWGKVALEDVHAEPVDTWLLALPVGNKRKGHILNVMRLLFVHAKYIRWYVGENPMRDFKIVGGTKRAKSPGTLTREEFHDLLTKLDEPVRTMVTAAMCWGLRISELLAIQWQDLDFLSGTVRLKRGIVEGRVGRLKNMPSEASLPMHQHLASVLLEWRKQTEFTDLEQFVFASPWTAGERPYNGGKIQSSILRKVGREMKLPYSLGWHTFRHTYRAMLRSVGAPIDVQQHLMRHADIRTTMQTYGGTRLEELRPANEALVEGLFGRRQ